MKGGFVIIPDLFFNFNKVNAAILKFQQEVTDPKAALLPTYNTVGDIVRVPVLIPLLSLTHRAWLAFCRGVDVLRWAPEACRHL
jgi:hypothetical protein